MYPTLVVHIAAGLTAITLGYVALSTAKGKRGHRLSGRAFVYSMMTMALLGAWLAATHNKAPEANVPVGLLTAYLAITGLTTVKPLRTSGRELDTALAALALIIGLVLLGFGIKAGNAPTGTLHGIPTFPFYIFGTVAVLAGISDFRLHWCRRHPTAARNGATRAPSLAHVLRPSDRRFLVLPRPGEGIPQAVPHRTAVDHSTIDRARGAALLAVARALQAVAPRHCGRPRARAGVRSNGA